MLVCLVTGSVDDLSNTEVMGVGVGDGVLHRFSWDAILVTEIEAVRRQWLQSPLDASKRF